MICVTSSAAKDSKIGMLSNIGILRFGPASKYCWNYVAVRPHCDSQKGFYGSTPLQSFFEHQTSYQSNDQRIIRIHIACQASEPLGVLTAREKRWKKSANLLYIYIYIYGYMIATWGEHGWNMDGTWMEHGWKSTEMERDGEG